MAAHPDDETAMCGGTIALFASRGAVVTVVVATDGQATSGGTSPAATGAARRAEVTEACALLGAGPPRLLGYVDGQLASAGKELERELATVVGEVAPQIVIVPWWLDDHPDHRAVCAAVARTALPKGTTVLLGEIWTPLHPTRVVDITAVVEQKRRALEVHRTANRAIDMDAMLGLGRYRSLFGLGGHGYAEAFVEVASEDLERWVAGSD